MDGCNSFCKLEPGFVCPVQGKCECAIGAYLLYTGECVSICPAGYAPSDVTKTWTACGNSIIDLGENCDDGNTINNDGCNIMC